VLVGDRVRVLVKDQGPGMSDDVRERLFQPFVQGESPLQKKHQGTGLGLAICRRLVELQGGEIGADSEPGRGATFWFTIPIADHGAGSGPGAPGASGARPVRSAAGADRPQATVVVMAASPSAGSVAALLRNRGIRVLEAGGGAAGIALVRCERPDAVLCDLTAPDHDGLAVARELKADRATAGIPLIAILAAATDSVCDRAHAAGFDAYVTTPIDFRTLDACLGGLAGLARRS
jgi:CheY-like chemotaxis protein